MCLQFVCRFAELCLWQKTDPVVKRASQVTTVAEVFSRLVEVDHVDPFGEVRLGVEPKNQKSLTDL